MKVNTVPFRLIRPICDFFTFSKNLRKSEKSRKNYFRGQKKMGVTRASAIWQFSFRFSPVFTGFLVSGNLGNLEWEYIQSFTGQ